MNANDKTKLYKTFIESKQTRIVKSKKLTLITQIYQKIHTNMFRPHNPATLLGKNYIVLLFNKYTRKSWSLLLRLKDKFFNVFKLWPPQANSNGDKLGYF